MPQKISKPMYKEKELWGLILGGSSGLGWAAAQVLAKKGMSLCIYYRERRADAREAQARFQALSLETGVSILHYNVDATQKEQIARSLAELSERLPAEARFRLLLHSIAKGNLKAFLGQNNLTSTDFQLTAQNMAYSIVDWAQGLIALGRFAEDARILGLSSGGNQRAWSHYAAVSAAKTALEAIIRSMALEYAPLGIRANIVQAGMMNTRSFQLIPGSDDLAQFAKSRNPLGRMTKAEDVAKVIELLCRAESAWINGAIIPVDGGERLI